ncbi:DUF6994 family protein [Falsihalocynthiibacter arcticus]|uniref:DUF6994 family protein n=1 Tax=Falsihalocynthiibacter arcticus TaxID=1579316 RepID=UPI003AAC5F39
MGKDPDSHSPTLRNYHKALWSKKLPTGGAFSLSDEHPRTYLHHISERGEFFLSSDALTNTYRHHRAMAPIINEIPEGELDQFFYCGSIVGAYIIFPARMVDGKQNINQARGTNSKIKDRFDLTLECIKRHYQNEGSPLSSVLARNAEFFELFGSFGGYIDFFHLQDMILKNRTAIEFFLPFREFASSPLPSNNDEYRSYMHKQVTFIGARNRRIARQVL